INDRDDLVSDQHRLSEIAEHPLLLWRIGLEPMFVAEKELQAFALDNHWIEWRQNVDEVLSLDRIGIENLRASPMFDLAGTFDIDLQQSPVPYPTLYQSPHARFARCVHVAHGIQAHDTLRSQPAIQHVVQELRLGCRLGQPLPAEMARRQL